MSFKSSLHVVPGRALAACALALLAAVFARVASAGELEDFQQAIRAKYDMKEAAFAANDPEPILTRFYTSNAISTCMVAPDVVPPLGVSDPGNIVMPAACKALTVSRATWSPPSRCMARNFCRFSLSASVSIGPMATSSMRVLPSGRFRDRLAPTQMPFSLNCSISAASGT